MRSASAIPGTAAVPITSDGKYSDTSGSNASKCVSMMDRMSLNDRPSVAGYTESTRPCVVAPSSSPKFTNSRGWNWRPWKNLTEPVTSRTSPLLIVRSRKGWPGHETSIIPVSSRSTAWKIRRPFRVGITPLEITVPIIVPCIPGSRLLIGVTVLASS